MNRIQRDSYFNVDGVIIGDGEILNSNFIDSNISEFDALVRPLNRASPLMIISPTVQFLIEHNEWHRNRKLIVKLERYMGLNKLKKFGVFGESQSEEHHSWVIGLEFPTSDGQYLQPCIITPDFGQRQLWAKVIFHRDIPFDLNNVVHILWNPLRELPLGCLDLLNEGITEENR